MNVPATMFMEGNTFRVSSLSFAPPKSHNSPNSLCTCIHLCIIYIYIICYICLHCHSWLFSVWNFQSQSLRIACYRVWNLKTWNWEGLTRCTGTDYFTKNKEISKVSQDVQVRSNKMMLSSKHMQKRPLKISKEVCPQKRRGPPRWAFLPECGQGISSHGGHWQWNDEVEACLEVLKRQNHQKCS